MEGEGEGERENRPWRVIYLLQRSPAEDFYLELMSFPKREIDFGLFRFETLAMMTALRREKAGTAQCVLAPISPLYVTVSLSSSVPAPLSLSPPAHSLLHYLLLDGRRVSSAVPHQVMSYSGYVLDERAYAALPAVRIGWSD